MKKCLLLIAGLGLCQLADAQLWLSGTDYLQNFNSLSPGNAVLPVGWQLSVTASTTALGADVTATKYDASGKIWTSVSNGFRNVASANGYTYFATIGTDSLAQVQRTDRALAIRQTSAVGDSSTAFMLQVANTKNLTDFKLEFHLQSLDSTSPRVSTWRVDYGIGANPGTFTAATITSSAPMTTGGNTFSNKTVTASFGSALDNQAGPVWIRIASLTRTTGSQNRATSAIDDFHLTWTGNAVGVSPVNKEAGQSLQAWTAANGKLALQYTLEKGGAYQLTIHDLSGKVVYHAPLQAEAGTHQATVEAPELVNGLYIISLVNGATVLSTKASLH